MRPLLIFISYFLVVGCIYAQYHSDYIIPDEKIEKPIVDKQPVFEQEKSVFKWAWEMEPYEHGFAQRYNLFQIHGGGLAYLGYQYGDMPKDSAVKQAAFFFGAFHPFVLDYESVDIAFGISGVARMTNQLIDDVNVNESDDIFTLAAGSDSTERSTQTTHITFSTIFNFPDQAFQIHTQIGHLWNHLRHKMDINFDIDVPDGFGGSLLRAQGGLDRFVYTQRDRMLYLSFDFRKFYDRNILSYFNLTLRATINLETYQRKSEGTPVANGDTQFLLEVLGVPVDLNGRQELPVEIDLQGGREVDINTGGAFLDMRLFTIPTDFPIPGLGHRGFSFNLLGGVEHRTGEIFGRNIHGVRTSVGGYVAILDLLIVIYQYSFEEKNDINDEWTITFVIGLYGSSGAGAAQGAAFTGRGQDNLNFAR